MAARLIARAGVIAAGALAAAGCAQRPSAEAIVKVSQTSSADRDCLARAMYFESHRGSDEGMLAVGTVVANRVKSGKYGSNYCAVVGQKKQFADGVLSRSMDDSGAERARRAADAIVSGKRHPGVHDAMFFHTAGLRFPYPNMRYVLVAGGNAFYEKHSVSSAADVRENSRSRAMALAYAKADPTAAAKPIMVASLEPRASQAATVATPVAAQTAPVAMAQASVTTTASIVTTTRPAAAPSPVAAAPVAVARATAAAPTPVLKVATQIAMAPDAPAVGKPAAKTAGKTSATPAPATTMMASAAIPPAAPARKASAMPVRTISVATAPVLASSTASRRAAPKSEPRTPVVAFAPEQAQPSFPSSGGSRLTANDSPVAQAWASFQ